MISSELKKIYNAKRQKVLKNGKIQAGFKNATFDEFENWFNIDNFSKGCYYCGKTNEMSNRFFLLQRNGFRPDATRGGKRGKRLELDRKDPFQPYDNLENIVWCCYWCNNAKSNFFTQTEFEPIAKEIGKALNSIEYKLCAFYFKLEHNNFNLDKMSILDNEISYE